ncbi:peptide deformylase [Thermoleophilia bacterium SCSIO 60948]|nr:peptide deformylase [Thermoleophilia bacterium SCSIO 60948]
MAVREVLTYPDPILKEVMEPVQTDRVDALAEDLIDTMRSFPGCVGIAAPQIGERARLAIVDVTGHRKEPESSNGLVVLANPRVLEAEGSELAREGCLSIPDLTANVRRATRIRVAHAGGEFWSEGFEARCVLHELDHLDGLLFLDRVASLSDDLFRRKNYAPAPERGAESPPSSNTASASKAGAESGSGSADPSSASASGSRG